MTPKHPAQRTSAFDATDRAALEKFFQELPTPIATYG
jgi:hypothetical protein